MKKKKKKMKRAASPPSSSSLPPCKFGAACYRTNPSHLSEYSHPPKPAPDQPAEQNLDDTLKDEMGDNESRTKSLSDEHGSNDGSNDGSDDGSNDGSNDDNDDDVDLIAPVIIPETVATTGDLEKLYHTPFPEEVTEFLALTRTIHPFLKGSVCEAYRASHGVALAGPFELLSGALAGKAVAVHSLERRATDPPEVTTVMVYEAGDRLMYFRDCPKALPSCLVSWSPASPHAYAVEGNHILPAFLTWARKLGMRAGREPLHDQVTKLLKEPASEAKPQFTRAKREVVAKTLSGLSVWVPMKGEVGYRDKPYSDKDLKVAFERIAANAEDRRGLDVMDDLFNSVDIGNDEGDFGLGLEVGLGLLCYADRSPLLKKHAKRILLIAYSLLDRPLYHQMVDKLF